MDLIASVNFVIGDEIENLKFAIIVKIFGDGHQQLRHNGKTNVLLRLYYPPSMVASHELKVAGGGESCN